MRTTLKIGYGKNIEIRRKSVMELGMKGRLKREWENIKTQREGGGNGNKNVSRSVVQC